MSIQKQPILQQLSLKRFLVDSATLNVLLSGILLTAVAINPEMMVQDYPPDIREKSGPKSDKAKRQSILLTISFFFVIIGLVVRSNQTLKRENGGTLSFKAATANSYLLFLAFWLFDLTILDWLIFVKNTPDFFVLPGTEGMAGYDDYLFHLTTALPALPLMLIPSMIIGLATASK